MFKRKKKEAEVTMVTLLESRGVRKLSKGYKLHAKIEYEHYGPIEIVLTLEGKKFKKEEKYDCTQGYLHKTVPHIEAVRTVLNAFDEKVYNETRTLLQVDINKAFGVEMEKKAEDEGLTID